MLGCGVGPALAVGPGDACGEGDAVPATVLVAEGAGDERAIGAVGPPPHAATARHRASDVIALRRVIWTCNGPCEGRLRGAAAALELGWFRDGLKHPVKDPA